MEETPSILVLGAYGLAGRAIVEGLCRRTRFPVVASGRTPEKIRALVRGLDCARIRGITLDATNPDALRAACGEASFVINAVGPYARHGAGIARVVMESGRPYLDCANEQGHYRRLRELDNMARAQGLPLVTAAGVIPGISTLVIAELLARFPEMDSVDCCWAQFRHAYADSGLASVMGGILEAADRPETLRRGKHTGIAIGRSIREFDLPMPFGPRLLLEVPTTDSLTLPARFSLQELHTWFYMGEMPVWLLGVVRLLQPHRRDWAYHLIERMMRPINRRETRQAIGAGVGPEGLLTVEASHAGVCQMAHILFRDGAMATACLPVHIAAAYLQGEVRETGLLTPLDLAVCRTFETAIEEACITKTLGTPERV